MEKFFPGNVQWGMCWKTRSADDYNQYFLGGTFMNRGAVSIQTLLSLNIAKGGGRWVGTMEKTPWPFGTVRGVRTMARAKNVFESMKELSVPPLDQSLDKHWLYIGMDEEATKSLAPFGYYIVAGIAGVIHRRFHVHYPVGVYFEELEREGFGSPNLKYFWDKKPGGALSPFMFYTYVYRKSSEDDIPLDDPIKLYRLYHVIKSGTEIEPPHETLLWEDQYVTIKTQPKAQRVLQLFTIDGVEQLPGALIQDTDLGLAGISTDPSIVDTEGSAATFYGPVKADVYVSSIADAIRIEKEAPVDIQMTTTDCLVEPGSWAIGTTNIPEGMTATVSEDGLVSVDMTPDVWEAIEGSQASIEILFNGYSRQVARELLLSVPPAPAFGTVWTPVTKLSTSLRGVFQASDGSIYISGTTKIWKTDEDLSVFTEMTLSGTVNTSFKACAEASNGRIVVADNSGLWVKPTGSNTFTKLAVSLSNSLGHVGAKPDSPWVWVGRNSSTGAVYRYNLDTTALESHNTQSSGLNGWVETPPVRAQDGSWIFVAGSTNGYSIARFNGSTMTVIVDRAVGYGNTIPQIYKEAAGRVIMFAPKTNTTVAVRYSDDNGLTWSSEQIVTANYLVSASLGLKTGYGLFASGNRMNRTNDAWATNTEVATLDGSIKGLCRFGEFKLLAVTEGTTNNVFKSEA